MLSLLPSECSRRQQSIEEAVTSVSYFIVLLNFTLLKASSQILDFWLMEFLHHLFVCGRVNTIFVVGK